LKKQREDHSRPVEFEWHWELSEYAKFVSRRRVVSEVPGLRDYWIAVGLIRLSAHSDPWIIGQNQLDTGAFRGNITPRGGAEETA
jgi:hypothetical protein